jgi:UDP-N-acetylglucosamine 2-epimerase (non-hydrolysing)
MKVMTILGTRPEIIRLSSVIPLLDQNCEHFLLHTGQNFDESLDAIFFRDLGVRAPNLNLGAKGSFAVQLGTILAGVESAFLEHRPDRVLILGDTNSGLAAIVAKRLGIAVYHMEAGNRCFDDRVPEEVNRRVIDHSSTVLLPYTERSRANLIREGIAEARIFTTGNPIKQVLDRFADQIGASSVLDKLGLTKGEFFLATTHRAENVDSPDKLRALITAFRSLAEKYRRPVVCSVHPRTAARLEHSDLGVSSSGLRLLKPLNFFDFIALEQSAFCCLSDSGTVQEETCIFGIPNVTIRDVTERPETVECGSNFVAGTDPDSILRAVSIVTSASPSWTPPREYLATSVAETCCRVLLASRVLDAGEAEWLAGARLR